MLHPLSGFKRFQTVPNGSKRFQTAANGRSLLVINYGWYSRRHQSPRDALDELAIRKRIKADAPSRRVVTFQQNRCPYAIQLKHPTKPSERSASWTYADLADNASWLNCNFVIHWKLSDCRECSAPNALSSQEEKDAQRQPDAGQNQ